MHSVRILRSTTTPSPTALSPAIAWGISDLTRSIWPSAPDAPPPNISAIIAGWRAQEAAHFIIAEENRVLANARIFRREIITIQGPLAVGALTAVCVHPDYRGRGWGADVVRAAFAYLPEMKLEVALFQTGVPQFYEKLGCRLIDNRFHNGGDYENVFWDDYAMIYPADFAWPAGEIDLNGPGY